MAQSDTDARSGPREREPREVRVRSAELFFDLVYVFAVTQISHHLLYHLDGQGALHGLILWFAVWLGWQYTCWVTNWFDADRLPVRILLFSIMLVALLMAIALPGAFGATGLLFAASYVTMQVGRTIVVLILLGRDAPLAPNFRRILAWLCLSAVFWIAGGLAEGDMRMVLWAIAIACEYGAPMIGFRIPGMGRSRTTDWTISGSHLAERCQLFVIVALGESILISGSTVSGMSQWDAPKLIALLLAFLSTVEMWWLYFDTGAEKASQVIAEAEDPGRLGARFHYIHVILIGGIIVSAAGNELPIAHPAERAELQSVAVLVGGPALYILGIAIHKWTIHGRLPLSHLAGLGSLAALIPVAFLTDLLMIAGLVTAVQLVVAGWESVARRKR